MLGKIAVRNVKRQLSNYLIYFVTVAVTVALMFAVNNSIYSPEIAAKAEKISELGSALIAVSVMVSLIIAFVLSYATSYMLKLRKREFGTYLTLGMTRKNIISVFLTETLVMGALALLVGLLLGLLLYQGLMLIIVSLMEIPYVFAAYSLQGVLLTIGMVAGVYLLSSLVSAIYLKKVSVNDLIHAAKKVEKRVKHTALWFVTALVALSVIIASIAVFVWGIKASMAGLDAAAGALIWSIIALAVGVVVFHYAAAKSVMAVCLKNKKLAQSGTNTFTLRQLSSKLKANSLMAGLLAFLLTFAIIGSNVFFMMKTTEKMSLDRNFPFDVCAVYDIAGVSPITPEKGREIIEKYNDIKVEIPFNVYDTGEDYLHSFTPWHGENYASLTDLVYSESEINSLYEALGKQPIDLQGGFMIYPRVSQAEAVDFSAAKLPLNGKEYAYKGLVKDLPSYLYTYIVAVVPDEAVEGLPVTARCTAMDLKNDKFDAVSMKDALSYKISEENGLYTYTVCDYSIREFSRITSSGQTAVYTISILYVAIVFVFMALAMLALKTLSSVGEDKINYNVLFKLGASPSLRKKTLFTQILIFFFLPFLVPLLLSIPVAAICAMTSALVGFSAAVGEIVLSSSMTALTLLIIYSLYFVSTYLIAKKNIL